MHAAGHSEPYCPFVSNFFEKLNSITIYNLTELVEDCIPSAAIYTCSW